MCRCGPVDETRNQGWLALTFEVDMFVEMLLGQHNAGFKTGSGENTGRMNKLRSCGAFPPYIEERKTNIRLAHHTWRLTKSCLIFAGKPMIIKLLAYMPFPMELSSSMSRSDLINAFSMEFFLFGGRGSN